MERGQEIVDRDGEGNVEEMVERLRQNDECVNHHWMRVTGEHVCETCHDRLRGYTFRCVGCHEQICRRCRFKRM